MLWLAQLRAPHVAIACIAWAVVIVALPRLTLLAVVLRYRVQARLSGARNRGAAFGGARWVSRRAMVLNLVIPPTVLLAAWMVARLTHPTAAP
jgi:hypothetical protein